jgi:hypothetical protein
MVTRFGSLQLSPVLTSGITKLPEGYMLEQTRTLYMPGVLVEKEAVREPEVAPTARVEVAGVVVMRAMLVVPALFNIWITAGKLVAVAAAPVPALFTVVVKVTASSVTGFVFEAETVPGPVLGRAAPITTVIFCPQLLSALPAGSAVLTGIARIVVGEATAAFAHIST